MTNGRVVRKQIIQQLAIDITHITFWIREIYFSETEKSIHHNQTSPIDQSNIEKQIIQQLATDITRIPISDSILDITHHITFWIGEIYFSETEKYICHNQTNPHDQSNIEKQIIQQLATDITQIPISDSILYTFNSESFSSVCFFEISRHCEVHNVNQLGVLSLCRWLTFLHYENYHYAGTPRVANVEMWYCWKETKLELEGG